MASPYMPRPRTPLVFTEPPDKTEFNNGHLVLEGGWKKHQTQVQATAEEIKGIIASLEHDLNPVAQLLYRVAFNAGQAKERLVIHDGIHQAGSEGLHLSATLQGGKYLGLPKIHIGVSADKKFTHFSGNVASYNALTK